MLTPIAPLDDRSQLIREHMPLVDLVVQRMVPQVPSFMTREDMTSAAMVGLIDAANKSVTIHAVLPRRTTLARAAAGERS